MIISVLQPLDDPEFVYFVCECSGTTDPYRRTITDFAVIGGVAFRAGLPEGEKCELYDCCPKCGAEFTPPDVARMLEALLVVSGVVAVVETLTDMVLQGTLSQGLKGPTNGQTASG